MPTNWKTSAGLILLRKPSNVTSFAALGQIKRRLGTRKVGHTGTLDRFASGLLVVLSGAFTKLAPQLTGLDKTYIARVRFGAETETLDPEGELIAQAPIADESTIRERARRFVGAQRQVPPAYSAVHQNGERAYRRVRRGEQVELGERAVHVFELDVLAWEAPEAVLRIRCSKGTYVRALARDLGVACDSRAYVSALERIAVGPFRVEDAVAPDDFEAERDLVSAREAVDKIPGLRPVTAKAASVGRISTGGTLRDSDLVDPPDTDGAFGLLDDEGELLAVVDRAEVSYRYRFVVPRKR